jgi:non-heme chloroperoxidase
VAHTARPRPNICLPVASPLDAFVGLTDAVDGGAAGGIVPTSEKATQNQLPCRSGAAVRLSATLLVMTTLLSATQAASPTRSGFFTTSDGVRLHYLEAGTGPPIVFVPGWTISAEIWQPQVDYFSRRYRVIALDPRSQGDSDQPAEGHYPERRARDIRDLVDLLKLEAPVLVGWSMAVCEVLSYVDQFGAEELRAVVLVDGFIKLSPTFAAEFPAFLKQFQLDRRKATDAFVRSMYRTPQSEAYLAGIIAASLKTPTNSAIALQTGSLGRLDWTEVFAKVGKTPALFVFETRLKAQAEVVRQRFPAAKVEVFEGAGHALFVDEAARFNRELEAFLIRAAAH